MHAHSTRHINFSILIKTKCNSYSTTLPPHFFFATMSTYKLIYFNFRARGEVSRLIFAQAGVKYKDERIEFKDWPQVKSSVCTPSHALPVLEVDSKKLVGSVVIERFLAERFGLAGSNDIENAEIAGIVDIVQDFFWQCLMKLRFEKDEEKKAQLQKKLTEEDIPKYWGIIEGMCKKNDSAEGWIYGSKPTHADFAIFHVLSYVLQGAPTLMNNFPRVAKLKAAVEALPNIAAWLKKRPETDI